MGTNWPDNDPTARVVPKNSAEVRLARQRPRKASCIAAIGFHPGLPKTLELFFIAGRSSEKFQPF
tara:strand:- start:507 stop:701 length:195 start_codon:yes stop_codon:yes gene_type:complete